MSNSLIAEELNTYPKEWGELSNEKLADSECPNLAGSYHEQGLVYQTINGKEDTTPPQASSHRITPGNFIKTTNNNEDVDFYIYSFTITQNNPELLNVIRSELTKNSYSIVTTHLDRKIGDFNCNNGWVVYSPSAYQGGSEGHSIKSNYEAKLTKLIDGSLLFYYKDKTSRRDMLVFNKNRNSVGYIKYLPSNPNPSFKQDWLKPVP
jgi:hypothetical protein